MNHNSYKHFYISAVCLKELKIFVPEAVIMGNAATLTCQYDLDNVRHFNCECESEVWCFPLLQASLYSVRWYFETEEFYRFVPKEAPPARTFPVSGINVDVSLFFRHLVYGDAIKGFYFMS